jgi:hypothetical protein
MTAVCIKNFFFLSFTLPLPPPACVRVRPPVNMVKEGKKSGGHGSSRAVWPGYARGNSRGIRLSLLPCPVRFVSTRPTLAHVAEDRGRAGDGATSNHNATRGNDAAASGRL